MVTTLVLAILIGQASPLPLSDCCNSGYLLAQHTPVSQACHLTDLNFYVSSGSGQLRLGVYTDQGGKPDALLVSTPAFNAAPGWNRQAVSADLPAGVVWLAYMPSSSSLSFPKQFSGQGEVNRAQTFSAGMPASFGTPTSSDGAQWSFYGTCQTTPLAGVNGAPSAPQIVLGKFGQMSFAWDYAQITQATGFRLYVGKGASGCPRGPYTAVGVQLTGTVSHLEFGQDYTAQATAIGMGQESECSNTVVGQPK